MTKKKPALKCYCEKFGYPCFECEAARKRVVEHYNRGIDCEQISEWVQLPRDAVRRIVLKECFG